MKIFIGFLSLLFFLDTLSFAKIEPIKSDFKPCYKKRLKSFVIFNNKQAVAVSKHKILLYSRHNVKKYIKRDPFLGLYLVYSKKELHPVKFIAFDKIKDNTVVAIMDKGNFLLNKIESFGNGLDILPRLQKKIMPNSLVECVCCRNFALTTNGRHFIDSDYIIRFLKDKKVQYSDSGLRFKEKNGKIFVKSRNPFFYGLRIRVGDEIVRVDGKEFKNVAKLSKYILFLKSGRSLNIVYKRAGKIFHQKIILKKRVGGGLIGDSFFQSIGLYLRHNLTISYIVKNSIAYTLGLKRGDRLLKINNYFTTTYKKTQSILSIIKRKRVYMLFSRDNFQFFVNFRR